MDANTIKCVVASAISSIIGSGGIFYLFFSKKLERFKHDLQSDLERKSIVYEHQKTSFSQIITAMDKVTDRIATIRESDGGEWRPIMAQDHARFIKAVAAERLFIDSRAERALDLFALATWEAVRDGQSNQYPDSDSIERAFEKLELIASRVSEHFRMQVGLQPDMQDPLIDVELLGACNLINTHHFPGFAMPTKSELSFDKHTHAEDLVAVARKNLPLLKSELQRLKEALLSNDNGTFFYSALTQVNRYRGALKNMKA